MIFKHTNRILLTSLMMSLFLSGCQTISPEERRAADERTCLRYGFKPNTDALARCLLDLDLDRRADGRAFQARADQMWGGPVIVERRIIVDRR